jgi:hypothetical protein
MMDTGTSSADVAPLPVHHTFHQTLRLVDTHNVIPRHLPMCMDLDPFLVTQNRENGDGTITLLPNEDWTMTSLQAPHQSSSSSLSSLSSDKQLVSVPGGVYCRPDPVTGPNWIQLGWSSYFHELPTTTTSDGCSGQLVPLNLKQQQKLIQDDTFPDMVLRAAARLHPGLHVYSSSSTQNQDPTPSIAQDNEHEHDANPINKKKPTKRLPIPTENYRHTGAWYCHTPDHRPIIGPLQDIHQNNIPGVYVVSAVSGSSDTMMTCGAGKLCAQWVAGNGDDSTSFTKDEKDDSSSSFVNDLSLRRFHPKD